MEIESRLDDNEYNYSLYYRSDKTDKTLHSLGIVRSRRRAVKSIARETRDQESSGVVTAAFCIIVVTT